MNYSQKLTMADSLYLTTDAAHVQQQLHPTGNQHQGHFNNSSMSQNHTPRMTIVTQAPSPSTVNHNTISYDRVPFPVVHSLMNAMPINDQ